MYKKTDKIPLIVGKSKGLSFPLIGSAVFKIKNGF